MNQTTLIPGSPEWAAHRARSCNASELAAVLGLSSYTSRSALIKQKATGIIPEVDASTQRRFDWGHACEAAARPLAEEIIGEELFASVFTVEVDGLLLSASLDGHTMLNDVTWEHKGANASLIGSLEDGVIPEQYHPQMEQGLLLTGATRCLFMCSNGDRESMRSVWYESNPELRAKIIPAWKQLMADVAAYVPTEAEAKPTGRAPDALPALRIEVTGAVTASNLAEFKAQAMAVFQGISRDLQTDADFSDAEATVKWAKGIEDRLASAKESALAQTESIDLLFRTIDDISAEARRVRLDLEKLVKARKDAIKGDIVHAGRLALVKHITELNAAMPGDYMPQVSADFAGCIKGLKSVDSIRNAVDSELARAKIAAAEIANRIHINAKTLKASGLVVHDAAALVLKQPDDLAAVLAQRAADEKAREEAQRERIRAEEAARMERERAHAVQIEADRLAREQAEAVSAARIREEEVTRLATESRAAEQAAQAMQRAAAPAMLPPPPAPPAPVAAAPVAPADTGARIALGQINRRLDPVQITAAGLAALGFSPVGKERASVLYREADFPAICRAIACHVAALSCTQPPALQSA